MNDETPTIDDEVLDTVSREADACEITVLRRIVGLPVRGRTAARIDRVLRAHGLGRPGGEPPQAA